MRKTKARALRKGEQMRRAIPWVVGIGCGGLVLVAGLRGAMPDVSAADPAKDKAVQPAPAAAGQGQPEQEKIVYTFTDEAKMAAFTNLWRQRQGLVLRMTVLQSYWNEEQAALAKVNETFTNEYKLDVAKNYMLDDKRRVLIEREGPTPAMMSPTPNTAGAPAR